MGEETIKRKLLERVSENFFIIALGLAVPPFRGHSLDPPLRSRFQCRHIASLPYNILLERCCQSAPNLQKAQVTKLVSCCMALNSKDAQSLSLPRFPLDMLPKLASVWVSFIFCSRIMCKLELFFKFADKFINLSCPSSPVLRVKVYRFLFNLLLSPEEAT